MVQDFDWTWFFSGQLGFSVFQEFWISVFSGQLGFSVFRDMDLWSFSVSWILVFQSDIVCFIMTIQKCNRYHSSHNFFDNRPAPFDIREKASTKCLIDTNNQGTELSTWGRLTDGGRLTTASPTVTKKSCPVGGSLKIFCMDRTLSSCRV
jgi:hypothetical protein